MPGDCALVVNRDRPAGANVRVNAADDLEWPMLPVRARQREEM